LTASNTDDFLQQQKKTAFDLIDNLDVNDSVAIVVQSNDEASVLFPLKPDHNGARNVIDMLEIVSGGGNHFYDGVSMAVNVLSSVRDRTARKAVVIMTDVQEPQGTALPSQTIELANTLNTPLYMIGYNDANRAVLDEFANGTNGFTYLQRDMDENFDRLTRDITDFLNHEYVLTLVSSLPARDASYQLRLTVDINGETLSVDVSDVKGTARPMLVTFPHMTEGQTFTDEIRFEPQVLYTDGDQPQGLHASYTLESSPLGGDATPLNAAGTSDLGLTWNLKDRPGGEYAVKIQVEDAYGNQGEQVLRFFVASPLLVQFVDPASPETPITTAAYSSSDNRLLIRVDGSYGLSQILLRLNDSELGIPVPVEPSASTASADMTEASDDKALLYEYAWDTSSLAPGHYKVRVEAEDTRGNTASQALDVDILLSSDDPFNIFVFMILLVVLVMILTALTLVRRSTQKPPMPSLPAPAMNKRPRAVLEILANGLPGRNEYPLMEKNYLVGRSDHTDIQVIGLAASRTHAELYWDGTGFTWIELTPEKKNPAFINGYAVNQKHPLQDGDQIQLGDTVMRFRTSL
jgi:hypothetical protein